ncbi:7-methyl-GTP pyrophosphatase-like [Tigriopus californicus]|uniref:7-methyl-GTP pyrophosphatase-like n=1 Tax=Tigriopus californicus TaxID=6832 RepID=UPI0027DA8100|nr:7-methyl-GTP pyrophosphatase-like [Tigriopus californicus]
MLPFVLNLSKSMNPPNQNDRPPAPPAPPAVILASSSPFRRNLMRLHFPDLFYSQAVAFLTPEVDERALGVTRARGHVSKGGRGQNGLDLANKEAELVGAQILITCDMVVKYRGQALEKPTSDIEARAFLQNYRDHPSEPVFCINGICYVT